MVIPISFSYSGNAVIAKSLCSLASSKMAQMEHSMSFQQITQLKVVHDIAPGITIITQKYPGYRHASIHVEPSGEGSQPVKVICLCNCNFTFGIIVKEQEEPLSRDGSKLYTVLACHNKMGYVIEKNVLATDFSEYLPGQKVLLIPYNEMQFNCCNKLYIATGCQPKRSELDIEEEDWRTTLRILPWRAFILNEWIKTNG